MAAHLKCFVFINYVRYAHCCNTTNVMKYLNVAEKNDAAKTIAGLLSNGSAHRREGYSMYNKVYDFEALVRGRTAKMIMTSVSGHLMQLEFLVSYRNWRNVDPRTLFDAPVRKNVGENYMPIKRTLEREVRNCQGLIIWTDCDREGENIGFEIIDVCRAIRPNLNVYRANFSEITTAAVHRALLQLGQPDKRQSDAVDVRTELDLRTGAAITRYQTLRLQRLFPENIADKVISYGSCQIPTLGFVAQRYKEIEAFVSEAFWKIRVLHTLDNLTVEFNWARNRLFDKEACENYLLICLAEPEPRATVESLTVKPKHKLRPTPLDTVEMEKLGSRKLKLSAKETMSIAEKLYSKGFISYPRTETNKFSMEFELTSLVEQQLHHEAWGAFAQRVLEWGPNPRNGNKSDQAHPPIHPTKLVTNLQGNEARVYELVVRHFLACVSKDAAGSETIVNVDIAGEKFSANGLVIQERNYLDVYAYDKWSAKQIHNYEQGRRFEPTEIVLHQGTTTAPPLLTEADLITLMEKHGIGTDATHAEHINTIKERGYIGVMDKGALVPGVIGMGLYEAYDAMDLALAKPLLRAEFEADLKRVCLGEKNPKIVLREQIAKYKQAYQQITDKITAMDAKIAQRVNEAPIPTISPPATLEQNIVQELFQCPKCLKASLALKPKKNRSGFFIGCSNFPDCKNVIWLPEECKGITVLDECCSNCGDGYRLLKFRFSSAYYRGLFNTPHGWYKNCLCCDELFRSTFNINLDQVKRTGSIVNLATHSSGGPGPGPGGSTINFSGRTNVVSTNNCNHTYGPSSSGNSWGIASNSGTQRPTNSEISKKSKVSTEKALAKGIQKAIETENSKNYNDSSTQNISYFTSTNTTANDNKTELKQFFDSNDVFEEEMLAAARMMEITNRGTETGVEQGVELDADIAAAFTADDDADFMALLNTGGISELPRPNNLDGSLTQWMRDTYEAQEEPMLWGRKGRVGSEAQPIPKRVRLSNKNVVAVVRCSGCHQPARQQIVHRDGPNKGRTFFKCPNAKECKFFQWADMSWSQTTTTTTDWLDNNDTTNNTASSSFSSSGKSSSWGTQAVRQRNARPLPDENSWGSGNKSVVSQGSQHKNFPNCATWNKTDNLVPNSWGSDNKVNDDLGTTNWSRIGTDINMRSNSNNTVNNSHDDNGIKCNCGKPAISLIVRKDCPNKGRPFFSCSTREKYCGFFQWGEVEEKQGNSNTNWSSGENIERQYQAPGTGGTRTSRARRCGYCREAGHTRNKCSRKNDLDD